MYGNVGMSLHFIETLTAAFTDASMQQIQGLEIEWTSRVCRRSFYRWIRRERSGSLLLCIQQAR